MLMLLINGQLEPPVLPVTAVTPATRWITVTRDSGPRVSLIAKESIDPSDKADFAIDLRPVLEPGENLATIAFTVTPEAVAMGFLVPNTGRYRSYVLMPGVIVIWVMIDPLVQGAARWNAGASCALEFFVETDSYPPRDWQRTVAIRVVQQ